MSWRALEDLLETGGEAGVDLGIVREKDEEETEG